MAFCKFNFKIVIYMNISEGKLSWCVCLAACSLSSCIPIVDSRTAAAFKNCTPDTLYIGASHYDNIDSIDEQVWPHYSIAAHSGVDSSNVTLWKKNFHSDCFVYPDSICVIDGDYLFHNTDTCYFFLIRFSDAKQNTWDEIRDKKIYRKWVVTRDRNGKFRANIR